MVEKKEKAKAKKETTPKAAKAPAEKKTAVKKTAVKSVKTVKAKKTAAAVPVTEKGPGKVEALPKHETPKIVPSVPVASVKTEATKGPHAVEKKSVSHKAPEVPKPQPAVVAEAPKPKAAAVVETPKPAPSVHKASENVTRPVATPAAAEPVKVKPVVVSQPEPPKPVAPPPPPAKPVVEVRFPITVGDLAQRINRRIPEVIKTLMGVGIFANVNQLLNEEIVFALGDAVGVDIRKQEDEIREIIRSDVAEDVSKIKPRPPVVTMMGHVDHGKTSLLDAIRSTNVAAKEKGFITQHIGAYGVNIPGKGHVTFLDTPGHEAFTAMRARGANVTDVVILVVAADDGVMPQTVEAIDHAREAGCPIVVAINKTDLPSANTAKVLGELQKIGLVPEEWGGKTICVKVSAKTGKGIDELLEMLLLQAEVLELKANPDRLAVGVVIESHISKGSGPVASIIIQKGTLKQGDIVVAGQYMGRVRAMKNDKGKTVHDAGPAYAVELSGLSGVPEAGETIYAVEDEKTAKKITDQKILEARERQMRGTPKHMSLESLYSKLSEGSFKELKLIIKADVQGSVEALTQSLEKLSTDKCRLHVIHGIVGGVNESDVMLAAASDAIIIGFHVKADPKAVIVAEKEGVDIHFYSIIYDAVEKIRKAMEGILEPDLKEVTEGKAKIRQIFKSSKVGNIGGAMVIKGRIVRQQHVRLVRDNVVIYDGKFSSLKRFKDDVKEVAEGYECGISLEGFNDLHEGDIVESYRIDKTAATL
ncbi:MAG TPA: translation initiation factor IF-2 [Candidatus Omnitrophota bacterium]|nr:translation initiation factor IF-2 [Candidatus Omnitrophota bacterium]HPS36237.1 translation initiation factor IF-2 [Candidatus Omnitrophota bacterium]